MRFVDELCAGLGAPPARGHVLGWDELRGLAREGVALAAPTRTHPLLSRVSLEEVRDEAAGSRRDLEREIGAVPPAFAYPSGSFTNDVVRALGEEGFEVAFTTEAGVNDLRRPHWLRLRRLNVTLNTSLPLLRARMLGGPGLLSPAQRSV
jgi:peptidoglycan/xylan/chitin deacetylase (PgdA/CDA1 family)